MDNGKMINKYVIYYKNRFKYTFPMIYNEIKDSLPDDSVAGRRSFIIDDKYWKYYPLINSIKDDLIKTYNATIDYALVHLYTDGHSSIAWHYDKEAYYADVYSVSFGATRKFRLRNKETKEITTVPLSTGDLLRMAIGCQLFYEHCIPKELKIIDPRINITFRKN